MIFLEWAFRRMKYPLRNPHVLSNIDHSQR